VLSFCSVIRRRWCERPTFGRGRTGAGVERQATHRHGVNLAHPPQIKPVTLYASQRATSGPGGATKRGSVTAVSHDNDRKQPRQDRLFDHPQLLRPNFDASNGLTLERGDCGQRYFDPGFAQFGALFRDPASISHLALSWAWKVSPASGFFISISITLRRSTIHLVTLVDDPPTGLKASGPIGAVACVKATRLARPLGGDEFAIVQVGAEAKSQIPKPWRSAS